MRLFVYHEREVSNFREESQRASCLVSVPNSAHNIAHTTTVTECDDVLIIVAYGIKYGVICTHTDRSYNGIAFGNRSCAVMLVVNAACIDTLKIGALYDICAVEHEQVSEHEFVHCWQLARTQELAACKYGHVMTVLQQMKSQFAGNKARADDHDTIAYFGLSFKHIKRTHNIASVGSG